MPAVFIEPWSVVQTGPNELLVVDSNGDKMFYIHGDQGDDGEPQSMLFWGPFDDELFAELVHRLSKHRRR